MGTESGEAAAEEGQRQLVHWGRGLDCSLDEVYDVGCLGDCLRLDDGYWKHAMVCGEVLQVVCGRAVRAAQIMTSQVQVWQKSNAS